MRQFASAVLLVALAVSNHFTLVAASGRTTQLGVVTYSNNGVVDLTPNSPGSSFLGQIYAAYSQTSLSSTQTIQADGNQVYFIPPQTLGYYSDYENYQQLSRVASAGSVVVFASLFRNTNSGPGGDEYKLSDLLSGVTGSVVTCTYPVANSGCWDFSNAPPAKLNTASAIQFPDPSKQAPFSIRTPALACVVSCNSGVPLYSQTLFGKSASLVQIWKVGKGYVVYLAYNWRSGSASDYTALLTALGTLAGAGSPSSSSTPSTPSTPSKSPNPATPSGPSIPTNPSTPSSSRPKYVYGNTNIVAVNFQQTPAASFVSSLLGAVPGTVVTQTQPSGNVVFFIPPQTNGWYNNAEDYRRLAGVASSGGVVVITPAFRNTFSGPGGDEDQLSQLLSGATGTQVNCAYPVANAGCWDFSSSFTGATLAAAAAPGFPPTKLSWPASLKTPALACVVRCSSGFSLYSQQVYGQQASMVQLWKVGQGYVVYLAYNWRSLVTPNDWSTVLTNVAALGVDGAPSPSNPANPSKPSTPSNPTIHTDPNPFVTPFSPSFPARTPSPTPSTRSPPALHADPVVPYNPKSPSAPSTPTSPSLQGTPIPASPTPNTHSSPTPSSSPSKSPIRSSPPAPSPAYKTLIYANPKVINATGQGGSFLGQASTSFRGAQPVTSQPSAKDWNSGRLVYAIPPQTLGYYNEVETDYALLNQLVKAGGSVIIAGYWRDTRPTGDEARLGLLLTGITGADSQCSYPVANKGCWDFSTAPPAKKASPWPTSFGATASWPASIATRALSCAVTCNSGTPLYTQQVNGHNTALVQGWKLGKGWVFYIAYNWNSGASYDWSSVFNAIALLGAQP